MSMWYLGAHNEILCQIRLSGLHTSTSADWSEFSGRTRSGGGIIRVVEMSENALNDFVPTRLYVRLIMMWIVMGIRTFGSPGGALWGERKHFVYHQDGAVIFFDLHFSLDWEEPFSLLFCKRTAALKPSQQFGMFSLVLKSNYLYKWSTKLTLFSYNFFL